MKYVYLVYYWDNVTNDWKVEFVFGSRKRAESHVKLMAEDGKERNIVKRIIL